MPFAQSEFPWSGSLESLLEYLITQLPNIISAMVIFLVGMYLSSLTSKLLKRGLQRRNQRQQLIQALTRLTYWTMLVLFTSMALQAVGLNLTAFLTGLGIIGFTIGFALQDVSKNFVAGLLLLIQQPFSIGDDIEVGGYGGKVTAIELRATEMRTFDGRVVLIPNADVFSKSLVNFTRSKQRRQELSIGVAYGSDLNRVQQIALETIRGLPGVLAEPAPNVVFTDIGHSSIDLTIYFWVETASLGLLDAKTQALVAINTAFEEAGIEIP